MTVRVTGIAGFIGLHSATRFPARSHRVVGIDNLDACHDLDVINAHADISAAVRDPGHVPRTRLAEGLAWLVAWHLDHHGH